VHLRFLLGLCGIALVAGCGGHPSTYAGMTSYEAAAQSADAIADESNKPKSPIHGLHPRLSKLVRDRRQQGGDAWVAVFVTGGPKICVWSWADVGAMSTTYNFFVDLCPRRVLRAKGELGSAST